MRYAWQSCRCETPSPACPHSCTSSTKHTATDRSMTLTAVGAVQHELARLCCQHSVHDIQPDLQRRAVRLGCLHNLTILR